MMRLRQVALVARDLRPVERAITAALDLEVCYRDPQLAVFGLRHGLYPIGDRILEVVAPRQPGTTAERYLDRRGGDGGYMVLVQVDDLDAHRRRLAGTSIRTVLKATADGIRGDHLHPVDVGGAILSIDQADPPESWAWAGRDWKYHSASTVVSDMVAVEMHCDDPDDLAARWGLALGRAVGSDRTIELDDATIRFTQATDGRGDGLAAIDLVAANRARAGNSLDLCGTRFNLV